MIESTLLLVSLLVAVSIFALIMVARTHYSARGARVAVRPSKLAAPTLRDLALARPWHERLFRPLIQHLRGMGKLLTPSRNLEQLRHDLAMAGLLDRLTVIDFLGLRALVGAGLGAAGFAITVLSRPLFSALLFALVDPGVNKVPYFYHAVHE